MENLTTLAHPRGLQGQMPPNKFFIFMLFLGQFIEVIVDAPTFMVGAPSSGKSWIPHCTTLDKEPNQCTRLKFNIEKMLCI